MSNRIDIIEAIRLYRVWQNWRQVAARMVRPNGMPFTFDAVQKAVRNHDLGAA